MAKTVSGPAPVLGACAVCLFGLLVSAPARAEASAAQKAAAESLFDDGLKAMKSGRFVDACPKLEESERIDPGIGTLLYLAECYEKTGRTASAWATFREAASSAQARSEVERARVATQRADRLQPSLSKLTIQVPPETRDAPNLRVTRDNVAMQNSLFGIAIPVDPGKYHLVVTADGYEPYETDVEIGANGDSKSVQIPALKPGQKPLAAPASQSPTGALGQGGPQPAPSMPQPVSGPATPTDSPVNGRRTAAWVTGAIGVVGLGVGSYFGVRAISKNSDAEKLCPAGDRCADPRGVTLTDDAKHAAVASNIAFAVGTAFVVGGVVLFLTSGETKQAAHVELHPLLSRDVAGVGLGGAFQ